MHRAINRVILITSPSRRTKMQSITFLLTETREKNEAFGSSLLLANSPMSPKVVNGSFAAIIDADEFLAKAYAGIRIAVRLRLLLVAAVCI
jgi:hypothetical protein